MDTTEQTAELADTAAFRHEALLYSGHDGFLAGTLPFIRGGLEADEPVLAMVGPAKIELLREALDGAAGDVHFADMHDIGSNPARIIPAWRRFVDEHGGSAPSLRGIGEPIWAERGAAELVECQRHESLLNLAFAEGCSMRLLCPYDTDALDGAVIAEAHRSHPVIVVDGTQRDSDTYHGIDVVSAPFAHPLSEPPVDAAMLAFTSETLEVVRHFVAERAASIGMSAALVGDLVLAVNEVATNSVLHGGGDGTLLIWQEGPTLICELSDGGYFDYPLAGRERPRPDRIGGQGLWLANQLCDLVQLRSFDTGTVVRLHLRYAG
ncbi:MAG TPA: sensor histidine kinase [Solirubrobacteraceae bacterium]|jgi:anti-sigma regulatory factor (Ser/Thr protein kinase)|nr:sensor histidine kinase [Solirubrobacteraceae bacterium]